MSSGRCSGWDEFYMAPSATTINENGKRWRYGVTPLPTVVFEGEVSTRKTQKSQPGFFVSLAIGWDATVITLPV
jgi:hypothetical protein